LVTGWSDSVIDIEFKEFSTSQYYNPVQGYLSVKGDLGKRDSDSVINAIARSCLPSSSSKFSKPNYHAFTEIIGSAIVSGKERIYVVVQGEEILVYE